MNGTNIPMLPLSAQHQQPLLETVKKAREFQAKNDELRTATLEFETMMVAQIMKQGLKSARQIADNEGESSNAYMDMAYDQMAEHLGRNSSLGLGEAIYENLKQRLR